MYCRIGYALPLVGEASFFFGSGKGLVKNLYKAKLEIAGAS
jgi:hypothetical protein